MTQKIEALSDDDAGRIEAMRTWVRDHYEPDVRHNYDTVEGKIRLLQTIVDSNWIAADEAWKLQCLGIAFGDVLVQTMGLTWIAVDDEYGRDPALRDGDTSTILFPMTSISKRIERGETVNVLLLVDGAHETVTRLRESASKHN